MLAGRATKLAIRVMSTNTKVETVFIVTNDLNSKSPWSPAVQCVNNINYIKLGRWDRHFTRFVTGRVLDLRRGRSHHISCSFLDDLQEQIHNTSAEVINHILSGDTQDGSDVNDPKEGKGGKPKRKRAARPGDKHLAPSFITVTLHAVEHMGECFPERSVKALWSVKGPDMWLELDAAVLEHVRLAILASQAAGEASRNKRAKKDDPASKEEAQGEDDL